MFRRLATVAAAGLAVLAFPSPAFAADSFSAPTTVVAPPCAAGAGRSDAAIGASTIRGFASFDACSRAIYYFQGGTQGYTRVLSPYRGVVLGVDADETATYLVYLMTDTAGNASGIGVTKRSHAGAFAATRVLSTAAGSQVVTPTADIGAEGGKWWAVWTEQVGPGGEFAPQQLFQAKTYGTAADHQQITFTGSDVDNTEPSISLDGLGAVMAWTRQTAPAADGPSVLRISTNSDTTWTSRVFSDVGTHNRTADVKRIAGFTFLTWVRDGYIVESENTTGTWTSDVFTHPGDRPRVAASFGSVFVAWTAANGVFYARGNTGSQSFSGQYVSAPGTVLDTMVAVNGKGTLLIRSGLRLYSITSLTASLTARREASTASAQIAHPGEQQQLLSRAPNCTPGGATPHSHAGQRW
jgi:hypothetical protein